MSTPEQLTLADLSDEYLTVTAACAHEAARRIAEVYADSLGVISTRDLPPIALTGAEAVALAAFVGVVDVLIAEGRP